MDPHIVIDLLILISSIIVGIPVPFCFMLAAVYMGVIYFPDFSFLMTIGFRGLNSLTILSIPFFIIAGALMSSAGIAVKLTDFANSMLGRIRGGMGAASIVACAIFGSISGTASSAVACIGSIMIPRLEELGYPRGYATGMISCAAVLGQLIPPSVPMILYGWVTQQSVAACFLSTVIPGILTTIIFCTINYFMVGRFPSVKVDTPLPPRERNKLIATSARRGFWSLLMPVIILGGIYGGIFTPTEAAAVAAIYSIPVGFWVYKGLKMGSFYELLKESATSVGSIMTMIMFCLMLSQTLVLLKVPQMVVELLMGLTTNKFYLLLLINIVLFIAGMIVNDITGIILLGPLLLPLVLELGLSPVHFGAIMGVNLSMGGVTPPYASILYLGMRIGKCEFSEILYPTMVLLVLGYIPVVLLTTYWAPLSVWLPSLLGY